MKRILSMFAVMFLSHSVFSQSDLELQRQLELGRTSTSTSTSTYVGSDATETTKDMTKTNSTSSGTTSVQSDSDTSVQTTNVNPYLPESGPLTLLNCSGYSLRVETFNEHDMAMWVPYKVIALNQGVSSRLSCATNKCKVMVRTLNIKTGAIQGFWVINKSRVLMPTNRKALSYGCSIY